MPAATSLSALIAAAKKASGRGWRQGDAAEETIDKAVFDGMTGALDRFSALRDTRRGARPAGGGATGSAASASHWKPRTAISTITAVSENSPAATRRGSGWATRSSRSTVRRFVPATRRPTSSTMGCEGRSAASSVLTIERRRCAGTREVKIERALVVVPTVIRLARRQYRQSLPTSRSFNQHDPAPDRGG